MNRPIVGRPGVERALREAPLRQGECIPPIFNFPFSIFIFFLMANCIFPARRLRAAGANAVMSIEISGLFPAKCVCGFGNLFQKSRQPLRIRQKSGVQKSVGNVYNSLKCAAGVEFMSRIFALFFPEFAAESLFFAPIRLCQGTIFHKFRPQKSAFRRTLPPAVRKRKS